MNNETDDEDDSDLFRDAMRGVKPLKSDGRVQRDTRPVKPVRRRSSDIDDDTAVLGRFGEAMFEESCPEVLDFARPGGAQKAVLKKLRTGKFPVEETLDLHGMTVNEASQALEIFLQECLELGYRHIIIVHGKGFRSQSQPVIKPMVNRWLRQAREVLAFHSAQPKDGGTGAVYVLLRKTVASG